MATIREVAKKAGVSIGTVSRYLNGYKLKKNNEINIQQAIDDLGFEENIIAKGLKKNRSMSIGVIINSLTDVFATSIVSVLENYLEENNYGLLICDYHHDKERMKQKLEFLRSRSVDGIVVFNFEEKLPIIEKIKNENIAFVSVDAPIHGLETDIVVVDNEAASFNVTEKLFSMGHKEIGIIAGSLNTYVGRERLKGYIRSMKNNGIFSKSLVRVGDFSKESGYKNTLELLKSSSPTAIYSTNYYMTLGMVQAIYEVGKKIPDDISIIGFDYFALSDIIQPKLTVIEQPIQEMGEAIGQLILNDIKGGKLENKKIELPTSILWRDSVKKMR